MEFIWEKSSVKFPIIWSSPNTVEIFCVKLDNSCHNLQETNKKINTQERIENNTNNRLNSLSELV
jgi:hypothetical protein